MRFTNHLNCLAKLPVATTSLVNAQIKGIAVFSKPPKRVNEAWLRHGSG